MTQWLRQLFVQFGSIRVDASDLACEFEVRQKDGGTPNRATITILNLSESTAQAIMGTKGQILKIEAGYRDGWGIIYQGQIVYGRKGKLSGTDTFVEIQSTAGFNALNFGVISKTLAAGHRFSDQLDEALKVFAQHGIGRGFITNLGGKQFYRAATLFGMAKDAVMNVARATRTTWTIQDEKFQITRLDEGLPGDIVLNANTGLIGEPIQTFQGVEFTCLINPRIRVGSTVVIDQKSISAVALTPTGDGEGNIKDQLNRVPKLAADGRYRVWVVEHEGATRANHFYTRGICQALGAGALNLTGRISGGEVGVGNPSTELQ